MIDSEGYRHNVAIVIQRPDQRVFWARRVRDPGWQFPQGGIRPGETPEGAMYRELQEETGLGAACVEIVGRTPHWLRYRLPKRFQRHHQHPLCIGQKQIWFLLRFTGSDELFHLDRSTPAEFAEFRWVDYWYPLHHVVPFKRGVYRRALHYLAQLM